MSQRFHDLPPSIRTLTATFRDGLIHELGDNLVAVYLLGSIAFPGFEPHAADLDFHVVVRRAIDSQQRKALARLHQGLAKRFRHGDRLDGFYIPLKKARGSRVPTGLVGAARGKLKRASKDKAWALHREHFHHRGYLALFGPDPREIYLPASREEVDEGLEQELDFIVRHCRVSPFYAVLNLCRLLYTRKTGWVTVSKHQSAMWALRTLPRAWHALIRAAVRSYQGKQSLHDRRRLQEHVGDFLVFAKQQMTYNVTFSPTRSRWSGNLTQRFGGAVSQPKAGAPAFSTGSRRSASIASSSATVAENVASRRVMEKFGLTYQRKYTSVSRSGCARAED